MKQKQNKFVSWLLIIAVMALVFNTVPLPSNVLAAYSITDAQELLGDSDLSVASTTHTFTFTTYSATPADGDWYFDFDDDGYDLTNATADCGYGTVAGVVAGNWGGTVTCTFPGGLAATTTQVVVYGVTSTSTAGSYYTEVNNRDDSDTILDRVSLATALIEDIYVTARVDSTLTFEVTAVNSGQSVNGINCDQTSTATTVPFGVLQVGATTTVCQDLHVTTNADDGYVVTVEQNDELRSRSGSNINSFNNSQDGTGSSTTPMPWNSPSNIIDVYNTYGHMGVTSDDIDDEDDAAGLLDYANEFYEGGLARYIGLNGYDEPSKIMAHDGPSDDAYQNVGLARIGYSIEIGSLQEAGDYENRLTYICTPTF